MTFRNQAVGTALSVAIALPMMAAAATTSPPDAMTKPPAKVEQAAAHHREHARTEPAMRGDDHRRATRTELHDHERKERDHD